MLAYPKELRVRVVNAIENGDGTIAEISALFGVGSTFVKKMLRWHRAGEDLAPRHGGGPVARLQDPELALLRDAVQQQPDVTLEEWQRTLVEQRQVTVSPATICRALQRLGLPRKKKSLVASERDEQARKKFHTLTEAFESGHFIFLDEMGSNLGLTRRYGRAAPGARVPDAVPGDRGGNISTIGAIGLEGVRTGLSVPGAIDGETMLFFVEELLVPTLNRGDIVLMDNASIHKLDDIEDALDAAGAGLLFLPAYAPDLNPIEHAWSKGKARLRSLKPRTRPALLDALVTAFATITPHDLQGWFRHCGYEVADT
jgi:transposase